MTFFTKLAPKSPDDRRIAMCVLFILVAEGLVFWLKSQVLFSDVRVTVALDLFQIFGTTLLGLAFCLHSNRKERLAALCFIFILYSITNLVCGGRIHAKCGRFKNPANYCPIVLNEKTIMGKTIRTYLIRDQKYKSILVARVEPINKQMALYWPLAEFGYSHNADVKVSGESLFITSYGSQRTIKVVPISAIP